MAVLAFTAGIWPAILKSRQYYAFMMHVIFGTRMWSRLFTRVGSKILFYNINARDHHANRSFEVLIKQAGLSRIFVLSIQNKKCFPMFIFPFDSIRARRCAVSSAHTVLTPFVNGSHLNDKG